MKCGLEIHQRICNKKLFCNCSAIMKEDIPNQIKRVLHIVRGESGNIDKAVLFESLKEKSFNYRFNNYNACLVETDSEPPHQINKDALITALMVAKYLKMFIPDEIHVMRKAVIDGSNTSGFQRTMIIGLGTNNSIIKTSKGNVRIKELDLEEESARIINKKDSTYSLNGLGIPLIELSTYPDIKSPEQAYEVALSIGELLRLTGKAQRGIGTIRQDVNISINGGARVEIKGFQELKDLPKLIRLEIQRQESLIKLKNNLTGYKLKKVNVTKFFNKSNSRLTKNKIVLGLILPGFKGLLSRNLNEEMTLGNELADYVKVMGIKGMIHEDENLNKYNLVEEFSIARNELGLNKDDLLLIIAGDDELLLNNTLNFLEKRIYLLNDKVPNETRVAGKGGVSHYIRPMPGGERMYPETDVPFIIPPKNIPQMDSKEERISKLRKLGISNNLINELILHPKFNLFMKLYNYGVSPQLVAKLLIEIPKYVKKHYNKDVSVLNDNHFKDIIFLLSKRVLIFESVPLLLSRLCESPNLKVKDLVGDYKKLSKNQLRKIIFEIKKNNKGLSVKALMGLVMKKVRGRAKGSEVMELLQS